MHDGEARWSGEVRFIREHLNDPIKWKKPLRIFVNSMSDLFHPGVNDEWIAAIFDVMARAPQHIYQILTKRAIRMRQSLEAAADPVVVASFERTYSQPWPPANWHFGVSIEDQKTANERIPELLRCRAATRIVSYEPAIGPVDFLEAFGGNKAGMMGIDWIIVGGESGPKARPMHPDWVRRVRDMCSRSGIPFFFKQWGEWSMRGEISQRQCAVSDSGKVVEHIKIEDFPNGAENERWQLMYRTGRPLAPAILDGEEWKEYP
jgi:protein gp37